MCCVVQCRSGIGKYARVADKNGGVWILPIGSSHPLQRGAYDNFAGHELSRFPEIADNPDMVTNLLYRQAKQSYETFSQ